MAAPRKYDWEGWFGRAQTTLTRGVDYHISQFMMCQTIKNAAWRRRVRVRLTDTGDGIIIEVPSEIPHPDKTSVAG